MNDTVTIKIFASLLHWAKKPMVQVSIERSTPLKQLLPQLGIPEDEVAVVIKNGAQVKLDTEVASGDTVSLFPVIDGG